MDEHDQYWKTYYPEFFKVYRPEQGVSNAFKRNINKILYNISRQYGFVSYGTVDAYTTHNWNVRLAQGVTTRGLPFPPEQNSCGLISLELHPSVGGGHWGAWVYFPSSRYLYLYDSMMVSGGKSNFQDSFKQVLRLVFNNPIISSATCATCKELRGIRLKSESRQPTGGFISNENVIMNNAIQSQQPLNKTNYNRLLGYRAQHQYCFAEAVMFLEDVMKGITNRRACRTGRDALIQVKRFIYNKLKNISPTSVSENFLRIYNYKTGRANKI